MENARINIYVNIHKGVRALMCETLVRLGRTDFADNDELTETLTQVERLLVQCQHHLEHENEFVHTAMATRRPQVKVNTAADHVEHEHHIARLLNDVSRIRGLPALRREQALMDLYRDMVLFVADNFQHMHIEETHNAQVLWDCYSDEEILGIEHAIIASMSPEQNAECLTMMLPNVSHGERLNILVGMREGMPPEVFTGVLQMLRGSLSPRDWQKVCEALDLDPAQTQAA